MKIVASNNSFVFDELGSAGFRLINAEPIIVATGDEALAAVRAHRPQLVILDAEMPALDGCKVCAEIKADTELRLARVILVLQGSISAAQLQRLAASGCDDVVLYRAPGEDLYHHAARLCGLPDLSLGEPVTLRVSVSDPRAELSAHAVQLSPRSVTLLLPSPLAAGAQVRLRMQREGDADALELAGEVTRSDVDPATRSPLAVVQFAELAAPLRAQLADLALWQTRALADGAVSFVVRGAFDQVTEFDSLRRRIGDGPSDVVFDLAGVRQITSWGARNWILFLRALPESCDYRFVNCSTVFAKHCSMVADMTGRGRVLSFALPYECVSCAHENARVLQTAALSAGLRHDPPEFRCGQCGGVEQFADLPDRYFSFLPAP